MDWALIAQANQVFRKESGVRAEEGRITASAVAGQNEFY